jgi:hypothetical protein
MAAPSKQLGPHIQFFFVVANLKHDSLGEPFDGNLLAGHVGDDVLTG